MAERTKVLIRGATGRDVHSFNTYFRAGRVKASNASSLTGATR